MSDLIRVPKKWLKENAGGLREDVHCYWRGCIFAQFSMWNRLEPFVADIKKYKKGNSVLDVGGGMGLLLPTLSKMFESVTLLDLDPSIAEKVVREFKVPNVRLLKEDVLKNSLESGAYDVVVTTLFLEHFDDSDPPIAQMHRALKPGGLLFVDLPTENWFYNLGRLIGRIEKPWDHYHGAPEIRPFLLKYFKPLKERNLPFAPFNLYYQAVLQKPLSPN